MSKKQEQKQEVKQHTLKKINKRKALISTLSILGITGLTASIISTSCTYVSSKHATISTQPTDFSTNKTVFNLNNGQPWTFNVNTTSTQNGASILKSSFMALSPFSFSTNSNNVGNNSLVLSALNSMNLPFLQDYLAQSLQITAYLITNTNSITPSTTSINLQGIYITNPNEHSAITVQFAGGSVVLNYNQGCWLYGCNGRIVYDKTTNSRTNPKPGNNDFTYTTIFTLNNLQNTFTYNTKTKTYDAPTLPPATYLSMAQSYLLKNYKDIFLSEFQALLTYLNNTSSLNVTAMGQQASISFDNLSTNFNDITFQVINNIPYVTIPNLTATNIYIDIKNGTNLKLKLNQGSLTFALKPMVIYQTSNKQIATCPAITNNSLADITFASSGTVPSNAINPMFGYYLATNTPLNILDDSGNKFTLASVSLNYLFTNLWMLNRPKTYTSKTVKWNTDESYGSIYDNGDVNIKPNSNAIPSAWDNVGSIKLDNSVISINEDDYNNLSTALFSSDVININKNSSGIFANIYQAIVTANPDLTLLGANTSYSFNVSLNQSDDGDTIEVISIDFYDNNTISSSNDSIYTINVDGTTYPIYPTYGTNDISASVNVNQVFSINANNTSLKNLTFKSTMTIPTNLINLNLYAGLFYQSANDKSNSNYAIINTAMNNMFTQLLDNNVLSVTNVLYKLVNPTTLNVSGLVIKNNSKSSVNLIIGGQTFIIPANTAITYNFSSVNTITLTGFRSVFNTINNSSSFDINTFDNGNYKNTLVNNFVANSTQATNTNLNTTLINLLANMFFGSNLLTTYNLTLTAYTSSAPTSISSTTTNTLTITSLTFDNKSSTGIYLNTINGSGDAVYLYLKPGISSITTNLTITGFSLMLGSKVQEMLSNYLAQTKTYLQTWTTSDLNNYLQQLSAIDGTTITSSMPSDTTLTYSNFNLKISNYNPNTLTFDLDSFTWDIKGDATNLPAPIYKYGLSTGVNITNTITAQLVPVVYFLNNGTLTSYPQIQTTATDTFSELGITRKVGIDTTLVYSVDGLNLKDLSNFKMGFFITYTDSSKISNESGSSTDYYGNGLMLPTISGADHSAEPYLNFSYAFNNFVMMKNSTNYGINDSTFATYVPGAVTGLHVYDAGSITIDSNNLINLTNNTANNNFFTLISNLYNNNDDTLFTSLLNLPTGISVTSYTLDGLELTNLIIENTTHITYTWTDSANATNDTYINPYTFTDISLNTPIMFNISSLSANYSITLTTEYKNGLSSVKSYYKSAEYLEDGYGYLYPIIWDKLNPDCFNKLWHDKWIKGDESFTITKAVWESYIDKFSYRDKPTFYMTWISGMMFNTNNASLMSGVTSYSGQKDGNSVLITNIVLFGVSYNVHLMINGGKYFSFM